MNDYQIKNEDELQFGITNVDYLFSQFSYANWVGNKGDALMPKKAQSIIYDRLSTQFKVFKTSQSILTYFKVKQSNNSY